MKPSDGFIAKTPYPIKIKIINSEKIHLILIPKVNQSQPKLPPHGRYWVLNHNVHLNSQYPYYPNQLIRLLIDNDYTLQIQ